MTADRADAAVREYAAVAGPVTVMGTGMLGAALTRAFKAAGCSTTVWNRSAARADSLVALGALRATTASAAVAASPLVVLCLSDYKAVREILDAAGGLSGRTFANLSSGTPDQARAMADWLHERGALYLDGAAMSGTRLVGSPLALFLFSGSPTAFTAHNVTLRVLGHVVDLGADPGLASLYDMALFGAAWSLLAGFYHAVALVDAGHVDARSFAAVLVHHLPFLARLVEDHAGQIEAAHYPSDDGTIATHAAAMDHLIETSLRHGIGAEVPQFLRALLARAIDDGHGDGGIARVIDVTRRPAAPPLVDRPDPE